MKLPPNQKGGILPLTSKVGEPQLRAGKSADRKALQHYQNIPISQPNLLNYLKDPVNNFQYNAQFANIKNINVVWNNGTGRMPLDLFRNTYLTNPSNINFTGLSVKGAKSANYNIELNKKELLEAMYIAIQKHL